MNNNLSKMEKLINLERIHSNSNLKSVSLNEFTLYVYDVMDNYIRGFYEMSNWGINEIIDDRNEHIMGKIMCTILSLITDEGKKDYYSSGNILKDIKNSSCNSGWSGCTIVNNVNELSFDGYMDFLKTYSNCDEVCSAYSTWNDGDGRMNDVIKNGICSAEKNFIIEMFNILISQFEDEDRSILAVLNNGEIQLINDEYRCYNCEKIDISCTDGTCKKCGDGSATILQKWARGRNQRWRMPLHMFLTDLCNGGCGGCAGCSR